MTWSGDFTKGFAVGLGVAAALIVAGIATGIIGRVL